MKVNSAIKVPFLNADYIDGIDSTALTRVHNVPYTLDPGAVSAPISLPSDRPVQLVGANLYGTLWGLGQASIVRKSQRYLQWVGLSYTDLTPSAAISSAVGIKIIDIAGSNFVLVETAGPSAIRVHNTSGVTASGSVSLMW